MRDLLDTGHFNWASLGLGLDPRTCSILKATDIFAEIRQTCLTTEKKLGVELFANRFRSISKMLI